MKSAYPRVKSIPSSPDTKSKKDKLRPKLANIDRAIPIKAAPKPAIKYSPVSRLVLNFLSPKVMLL